MVTTEPKWTSPLYKPMIFGNSTNTSTILVRLGRRENWQSLTLLTLNPEHAGTQTQVHVARSHPRQGRYGSVINTSLGERARIPSHPYRTRVPPSKPFASRHSSP